MGEAWKVALRWALGLPLGAGLAAAALHPGAPWWLRLALAVAAVALLVGLVAASSGWLFGPVLRYEMVRRARSPRVALLRVGYALVLLLALFLVYLRYTPDSTEEQGIGALAQGPQIDANEHAAFAAAFFHVFVFVQFFVLLLFTPALVGGAIATERQSGTLELLLTTDLTNREVVLGKLGAQLAHLMMLLLTGLPLLGLMQLLGGVDPNLVVIAYLGTILSLAATGATSLAAAVTHPQPRDALTIAYLFAFVHGCASLVAWVIMTWVNSTAGGVGGYACLGAYAAYVLPVVGASLWRATAALRSDGPAAGNCPPAADREAGPHAAPGRHAGAHAPHGRLRPPLGSLDPMLWKELPAVPRTAAFLHSGDIDPVPTGVFIALMLTLWRLACFCPIEMELFTVGGRSWNGLILVLGVPAFTVILVCAAVWAAGVLSPEREAHTLEGLLTTPLSDQQILRGKWLGCVWRLRWGLLPVGLLYFRGLASGGVCWWAFPLVLAAVAVHVAFVVNLGMYCSAVCSTTLRAVTATVVSLALVTVGHWLLALVTQPLAYALWGREAALAVYDVHLWGLTMPCNLAAFCAHDRDAEAEGFVGQRLLPGLAGLAYYGGLALLLWWRACRRMSAFRGG